MNETEACLSDAAQMQARGRQLHVVHVEKAKKKGKKKNTSRGAAPLRSRACVLCV